MIRQIFKILLVQEAKKAAAPKMAAKSPKTAAPKSQKEKKSTTKKDLWRFFHLWIPHLTVHSLISGTHTTVMTTLQQAGPHH